MANLIIDYGNWIVTQHMFWPNEILAGQKWMGSGGNVVEVEKVSGEDVFYFWYEDGEVKTHNKLSVNFQCRYCMIVGEASEEESLEARSDKLFEEEQWEAMARNGARRHARSNRRSST